MGEQRVTKELKLQPRYVLICVVDFCSCLGFEPSFSNFLIILEFVVAPTVHFYLDPLLCLGYTCLLYQEVGCFRFHLDVLFDARPCHRQTKELWIRLRTRPDRSDLYICMSCITSQIYDAECTSDSQMGGCMIKRSPWPVTPFRVKRTLPFTYTSV